MYLEPDSELAKALDVQLKSKKFKDAFEPTMFGWSRTVREAIGMPASSVAKRLKISQPAATQLERSEERGSISIERLEALANAFDCDFVYGFIPRNQSFQQMAAERKERMDDARLRKVKIPRA